MFLDSLIMIVASLGFSILYLILFPYLAIPNFVFSSKLVGLFRKSKKYKRYRHTPLIFAIGGVLFYLTVDLFESINASTLWFGILSVISLLPLLLYVLLRNRKL